MRLRFSICSLLWLMALVGVLVAWQVDRSRLTKRLEAPIPAADLVKRVKIKGVLGEPLWELITVRGTWRDRGPLSVGDLIFAENDFVFEITEVNGKPLSKPIDSVEPSAIWYYGEPAEIGGVNWDWNPNMVANPKVDPPKPADGETWELFAFETGGIQRYSSEVAIEAGLNVPKPGESGFVSQLKYIRMLRLPK